MNERKKKNIHASIAFGVLVLLGIGVAIPKLTVHDLVPVNARQATCVAYAVNELHDNPLERFALLLGKSRVVRHDGNNGTEIQSFTLFRIPLGALRGQPDMKIGVFCDENENTQPTAIETVRPTELRDGIEIQGLGTFHDSAVQGGVKSYQSERLGVFFNYPKEYRLFEGKGEGVGGAEYYVIVISPEPYISEAIARIPGGEWPASIHLSFYREPNISISLEQWIRTKRQSNFDTSDPAQSGMLTPTTVAGLPALAYHVFGLYEAEYIAFLYGEWVVLAVVANWESITDRDFQTILDSLRFEE